MEGEPQSSPFKEFRQFYFGSLLRDIITLLGEWPHLHFEPGLTAEMTPRTTVPKRRGARNSRTCRRSPWTSPRPVRIGDAAIDQHAKDNAPFRKRLGLQDRQRLPRLLLRVIKQQCSPCACFPVLIYIYDGPGRLSRYIPDDCLRKKAISERSQEKPSESCAPYHRPEAPTGREALSLKRTSVKSNKEQ